MALNKTDKKARRVSTPERPSTLDSDPNAQSGAIEALRAALRSAEAERDLLRESIALRQPDRQQAIDSVRRAQDLAAELQRSQYALDLSETNVAELTERCGSLEDNIRELEAQRDALLQQVQSCQQGRVDERSHFAGRLDYLEQILESLRGTRPSAQPGSEQ